ncbi:hypothetical protein HNY73_001160 [Argiope bruennichi]|uniref:Uncharacterized protein n=1 Tax=Argiope bruennichi TaxID=94029 RepID=A0A8T0G6G4_ARGBR|nr:hypothetical protein HNY73_001160 [Argiope bruennichi]
MEIKICLAHVIAHFKIVRSPQTKVPLEFNLGQQGLLQPKEVMVGMESLSSGKCHSTSLEVFKPTVPPARISVNDETIARFEIRSLQSFNDDFPTSKIIFDGMSAPSILRHLFGLKDCTADETEHLRRSANCPACGHSTLIYFRNGHCMDCHAPLPKSILEEAGIISTTHHEISPPEINMDTQDSNKNWEDRFITTTTSTSRSSTPTSTRQIPTEKPISPQTPLQNSNSDVTMTGLK